MGEYYISHSSSPWKKHKYIKKIGEGANAIYTYAKTGADYVGKAGKQVNKYAKKAGEGIDWRLGGREEYAYEKAKDFENYRNREYKSAKKFSDHEKKTNGKFQKEANESTALEKKKYNEAKKETRDAKEKYEKTPKVKARKAKNKAKKVLNKIWNKVYTKEPSLDSYYR